jgi:uncharacterized membrane protein YheB (UPF0754 family)
MNIWLLSIPVISAFIGWVTNWVAIKMLFHPRIPIKILGVTFHGIFPKRQKQFAEKLGQLVSRELISFGEIEEKVTDPENFHKILPFIEDHVDVFLKVKLGEQMPMIKMFVGDKILEQMKEIFLSELKELFPLLMKKYMNNLQNELDLEKIVIEKVSKFSSDKLEAILYQIMTKEFMFIEIIGAVLGFIIGVIQVLITIATT